MKKIKFSDLFILFGGGKIRKMGMSLK